MTWNTYFTFDVFFPPIKQSIASWIADLNQAEMITVEEMDLQTAVG